MQQNHPWNREIKSLVASGVTSALLTVITYWGAISHALKVGELVAILLILTTIQAGVQLVFSMHLGIEPKPRWNLIFFIFTVVIMIAVVAGSMWIMYHLNYNMMMPMEKP